MVEPRGAHVVLLKFIAAEDHQALRLVLLQHDFDEFLPERPGPARHQNCLFRPIHPIRLVTISVKSDNLAAKPLERRFSFSMGRAIPNTSGMDGHRLGLTLPASIADFPGNRSRDHAATAIRRRKFAAVFRSSNAKMSHELFCYSVRNNSLRDGPASSTRDLVLGCAGPPCSGLGAVTESLRSRHGFRTPGTGE